MTPSDAIALLDRIVGDPTKGLPEDLFRFIGRITPLVNVDLLIRDDDARTLFTWRSDEIYGPGWHIPGGIIRYQETAHHRIREVARQELGTSVEADAAPLAVMENLATVARERSRGHMISLLYRCRLNSDLDPRRRAVSDPPNAGDWRWYAAAPPNLLKVQNMYRPFIDAGNS